MPSFLARSLRGAASSVHAALAGLGSLVETLAAGRRRSPQMTAASDSRYRSVVETMSEGVVVQNADGRTELWNTRALELFGVTARELCDSFAERSGWHSIRPDGTLFLREELPLNVTMRTGEPRRDVVMGVHRRDGVALWLSVNTSAIRERGRVTGVVCTFNDITRRREMEEARRASEERFRVVADRVGSMIYDHDLTTGELYRSAALGSVFNWDESEPTIEWWLARIHPDDVERVASVTGRTGATGDAAQWTTEYRFRRGDGSYVPVIERGVIVPDQNGVPQRCIGTVMDSSDRAELASQLRQAQKMEAVGQLAGGIAHDFNNLLTSISCNVELLLDEIAPSDSRHDDVVQIREAAERAATLTQQLLTFSRRQAVEPKELDLNLTVASMERMLRRVISADVRLHTLLADALPPVFADAGQMEQVVMNLVLNARDAMPAGGMIVVRTAVVALHAALQHRFGMLPPGDYVTLSVKDAGTGISPQVLERLFEPFFSTKPRDRGTGLGLATVHGIIRQSEGQVVVDSAVGVGTEFIVYLPAHRVPREAKPPAPPAEPPAAVGHTVLVVDDESAVRDVTMRAIARAGYRVIGASSGADALSLLAREPDSADILLLTDIMMPVMNGHELAERVGKRYPAVRLACMSGFSPEEMARQGMATPSSLLLHKPFTLPQLVDFVNRAFATGSTAG